MREPAAHGCLQVPRRVQCTVALQRGTAPARRRRVLVGQPCAGNRAVGAHPRHSGDDRDAAGRTGREDGRDARLRRQRRDLRPLHRGSRADRARARGEARAHAGSALRSPGRDRRPGHRGQGTVRRSRPARRGIHAARRRRPAVGHRARHAGAVAAREAVRRRARSRQRRPAIVPVRHDRAHRHAAHDRRWRADAAPRQPDVPDPPPRRRRHPDRDGRGTGRLHALLRHAHEARRRADRLPVVRRRATDEGCAAGQARRRGDQRRQRRSRELLRAGVGTGLTVAARMKILSCARRRPFTSR
ncbi:hypothetical protein F01_460022 [Burkholderia cenocepacia]|nr:hypothetical protein F01_460022 [Burkholderia cenocepacia]